MQTFTSNSAAFSKALGTIISVVQSKPLVPATEGVLLIVTGAPAGEGATLRLFCSDLQSTVSASCPINATENWQALIPARHLLDTLRGLSDQPVKFTHDPGTFAFEIKASNSKYRLAGMNPTDFPKPTPVAVKGAMKMTLPESLLYEAIKTVHGVVHNPEASMKGYRPQFESLCVDVTPNSLRTVGVDGLRIAVYEQPLNNPKPEKAITATEGQFMIPRAAASHLLSVLNPKSDEPVTLTADGTNARLTDARWFSRLTEGTYGDYMSMFADDNTNFLRVNAPELLAAVKRLDKYAPTQDRSITFALTPDQPLTLTTQSYDGSHEGRETVPCEYEGEAMQIAFRGPELAGLLALWQEGEIELAMGAPSRTAQIRQYEGDHSTITCLQAPLVVPVALAA